MNGKNNNILLSDSYDDCPICWKNFVDYCKVGYDSTHWFYNASQILDASLYIEGAIRYFPENRIEFKSAQHKLLFQLKWS